MRLLGGLALGLLLAQALRLSARCARALGSLALLPAVLAAVLGLLAVVFAEGLSLVGALRPAGVGASVALTLAASAALGLPRLSFREWAAATRRAVDAGGPEGRLAAAVLGLLIGITFFLALASPPNTDDALAYHLPPIRHWLERGSVAHYPTAIDRQLRNHPLAAYLRLPLEAVTGSDALYGLVQWLFYVLVIAQAAGLAWMVTGEARLAWRSAAVAGTLPMAILQASSTQNDLVVAGYALGSAAAIAALVVEPREKPVPRLVLAGVCVGLGAHTKGTGLLLAGVLLPALILAIGGCRSFTRRERWAWVALSLALAAVLAAPPLVRNRRTFGDATWHWVRVPASAWLDGKGPARVLFQMWRGALIDLQPLLPRDALGAWILGAHGRVLDGLGLEESDPLLTWTGDVAFLRRTSPRHEDTAGNPLHFLLALATGGVALASAVRRRDGAVLRLAALGGLAWMALTVPVRFSPWHSRTHLPAFALLSVPTALAVGGSRSRGLMVVAVLALGSAPPLLANASKPLLPLGSEPPLFALSRWENRFRARPELRPAVERVIQLLPQACAAGATVGLQLRGHQAEYALWAGARHFGRDLRFRHFTPSPPACAAVSDRCPGGAQLCLEGSR